MASPFISPETPIQLLDVQQAWDNLTIQEKLYAYYFSKASWEAGNICFFQRSYESPGIFLLLQEIFRTPNIQAHATTNGFTPQEWRQFLAYSAGIYGNTGNYRGFGDTKFIPEVPKSKLDSLISSLANPIAIEIWEKIGDLVYNINPPYSILNFPDKQGVTAYYSSNVSSEDAEFVKAFLQSKDLTDIHINSRLWKLDDNRYQVRLAGIGGHYLPYLGSHEYEGKVIEIVNNDFSVFMRRLVQNLSQTLPYANPTQQEMIVHYINSFTNGDIQQHKDSQRKWIRDIGPVIETNIGFIETYVDPLGIRAEFEGLVSIVDKVVSRKFAELVNRAAEIIAKLPWGPGFEKDQFNPPDFTSLDVLTFANSGVPIGINIPNYDDIRTTEGFKNVSLGNAYPKVTPKNLKFLSESDVQLILSNYQNSSKLNVALHELLGHGSGKLLIQKADGSFNFNPELINPVTGQRVDKWYKADQTWSSVFGGLSNPYEECRAETVAVYLACFPEPFEVFQIENVEETRNTLWLNMAYSGIKSLLYYNPEQEKWGQAHCRARYVILRVMLEAPNNFLRIEFTEDSFILHMDYSQLMSTGFQAISEFLTKLHVFKATADIERGQEMFDRYSVVDQMGLRLREIVVANQEPRKLNVQVHLEMEGFEPKLVNFSEDFEGVVESFRVRFPEFDREMYELWSSEFRFNVGK